MKENKSNNECPSCKGELEYEGTFRRRNFRFDQYRCKECRHVLEKEIDKSIEKTFPIIRDISIEVLEEGKTRPSHYNKSSISEFLFICPNQKCTNPGIYIVPILREMIEKHQLHHEKWEICNGFEASPQGLRKKPCMRSFKMTIDIVLDENEEIGS